MATSVVTPSISAGMSSSGGTWSAGSLRRTKTRIAGSPVASPATILGPMPTATTFGLASRRCAQSCLT